MFVKKLTDCTEFIANDGCRIRELLHPVKDGMEIPYSLAIAQVDMGKTTYKHRLRQTEIYFLLEGSGLMHIDEEIRNVSKGDVIVIPPQAVQWIENTGTGTLVFTAIVNPPWNEQDDIRLE